MFKIDFNQMLNHPVQASLLLVDFGLLMFMPLIRPPVLLSILLVGGLVYLSMYFGAVFAGSKTCAAGQE
jgi:hypothetical protein